MEEIRLVLGLDTEAPNWWQMSARAAVMLVYAVVLYRIAARRTFGANTPLDIVVAVILGSAFSRAITGNADLVPVMAATAVVVLLHAILAMLAQRSSTFSTLLKGSSIQLIENGKVDWRNARRAQVGEGDLREALRLHGLEDESEVKAAYIERNGRISVIAK